MYTVFKVKYLESFKTDNFIFIVSDLCQCDLLSKVNSGEDDTITLGLPENQAKRYFRQVCRGVLHLHRYKFAHRDLKLENMLIDDGDIIKLSGEYVHVSLYFRKLVHGFTLSLPHPALQLINLKSDPVAYLR
jgi:hypothetical protein